MSVPGTIKIATTSTYYSHHITIYYSFSFE